MRAVRGMVASEELRSSLERLPGVARAAVDVREGREPVVRVWLDGSADADDVADAVRSVLERHGVRNGSSPGTGPQRRGLGRGLESLIPTASEEREPAHLQEVARLRSRRTTARLAMIAVEETPKGVVVRATDSNDQSVVAEVPVGEHRLEGTVTAAVARLLGYVDPVELVAADTVEVGGVSVLTVVVRLPDGSRAVGSAEVQAGMPFTLGTAVWRALESAD